MTHERSGGDVERPDPSRLRPCGGDVWLVELPLPPDHPSRVSAYIVRDVEGGLHVIDPGWRSPANERALAEALLCFAGGVRAVRSATATHHHADHLGLARWLRDASDAAVAMHAADADALRELSASDGHLPSEALLDELGVPPARRGELIAAVPRRDAYQEAVIDRLLVDGDRLDIPGRELRVVHVPGHTAGHVCIVDEENELILTGDHVLPDTAGGIDLGGDLGRDPLGAHLGSLARMTRWDGYLVLPGHGMPFHGLASRCAQLRARLLTRTQAVARAMASGHEPKDPWSVAVRIPWARGWDALHGESLLQALVQTRDHQRYLAAGGPLV